MNLYFVFTFDQVRKELGIGEDTKVLIYNFGGQVEIVTF